VRAVVHDRYGTTAVVRVDEIPKPVPGPGEILVRIQAASVNRADLDQLGPRPGFLRLFLGIRGPRNRRLGSDAAGVVEAIGPGAARFRPGDRVFGDLFPYGQGSFAEWVAVPEKALMAIPADIATEVAATLPHAAILAFQGLRTRSGGTPGPGSRVLIDGASGNTGPFAVHIAKAMGAEVTGVCRTEKVDFVRSLGADHVVDYRAIDVTRTGDRYDWILAADSHHSVLAYRRALRPGGRFVTLGGGGRVLLEGAIVGPASALFGSRRAGLMVWWKPFHEPDVLALIDMIRSGTLRPAIDRTYPLEQTPTALRAVDDGLVKGKVVITMPAAD
jgi:NADPH:quinone reductase-like Zn-dependent oxidoreductase